ncbi:hypothetical protein [uncultured Chryseobacterium sp.]|uniref:hypothetical protein n=1 Tax=uncultured Chryseobacterium sp. TaxID=259322 RepID=UPI0025EB2C89|nr:hypothetical protein [uncultured Chryseobacterium sp.]
MKKYLISSMFTAALLFSAGVKSQIAIGKTPPVTITNSSVLLEFGTEAKGIILPSVTTASDAVNGTFVLNTTTKSVRVKQNGVWTDLTQAGTALTNPYVNAGTIDVTNGVAGAVIGAAATTKPGVLVLESTTKALVLPKVSAPETNILSPVSGTMVYDTATSMLAVYDGTGWSYWK